MENVPKPVDDEIRQQIIEQVKEDRERADLDAESILSALAWITPQEMSDPAGFAQELREWVDTFDQPTTPFEDLVDAYLVEL